METKFEYSRDNWTLLNTMAYKKWLYGLRPLSPGEYVTCWLLLLASILGGLALVAFLGYAVWFNLAWYLVVGAVVLLVLLVGMILEVVRPRREPVRGLIHELLFRMGLQEKVVERIHKRRDAYFRQLEEKGQLDLRHRYLVRIEPDGLTLITEYPEYSGATVRQESRTEWKQITSIELDDQLLSFGIREGGFLHVPRTAFADNETCQCFVKTAQAYRANHAATEVAECSAIQRCALG